jgi:hypothetical protein
MARSRTIAISRGAVATVVGLTIAATGTITGTASSTTQGSQGSEALQIKVLSNRADLISGGDALAEIVLPRGAKAADLSVHLEGRNVTEAFAPRPKQSGRILGLVTGLRDGTNRLVARLSRGRESHITITNHPIGGPVFSGRRSSRGSATRRRPGSGHRPTRSATPQRGTSSSTRMRSPASSTPTTRVAHPRTS